MHKQKNNIILKKYINYLKRFIKSCLSRQRIRVRQFINFKVGRSVSVNLFNVFVLINKIANRVYETIYTRFAQSLAVVF